MTDKISTPNDIIEIDPDKGDIFDKTEDIQKETASSVEESLSKNSLTSDERIAQLAGEVHNLSLGLSQMIEISKMLIKGQIESASTLEKFIQSTESSLATIVQTQKGIDVLLQTEKDRNISKQLMSRLQNYVFGYNKKDECLALRKDVLDFNNINAQDRSGNTLLDYAVSYDTSLLSLLLQFPEIEVNPSLIEKTNGYVFQLLRNYLGNKKK